MQSAMPIPQNRAWSVIQMALLLATMEAALWSQGSWQKLWYAVSLAVLVVCVLVSHPRASDLGVGWRGLKGSLWAIPLAALICGGAIFAASQLGTLSVLYGSHPVYWHSLLYAIWALEQQFILNSFFYRRFESLLGDTTIAVVITAGLFALVHIPNPVLMPATFLGGIFFVEVFRRWRNIYAIAVAHAMFGLTLAITVPNHWIRNMRVGIGFLRFHIH
jgi:hypothetical protein